MRSFLYILLLQSATCFSLFKNYGSKGKVVSIVSQSTDGLAAKKNLYSRVAMFYKGSSISSPNKLQNISRMVAILIGILPAVFVTQDALALNMGTVFEKEEILTEQEEGEKFDFIDFFKQVVDPEEQKETEVGGEQVEIPEGVPKENIIDESNAEDSLPPIATRQIDRMLRSGIGVMDARPRNKPLFGDENEFGVEGNLLTSEGLESRDSPPRGLPTEEFLEEKAMFDEVMAEIMSSNDVSDIYEVHFSPIDSTVIPFISTAIFLYFWLRQGTDDEMPRNYDHDKIDGYFVSQPVVALERMLEIAAGMIELGIIRSQSDLTRRLTAITSSTSTDTTSSTSSSSQSSSSLSYAATGDSTGNASIDATVSTIVGTSVNNYDRSSNVNVDTNTNAKLAVITRSSIDDKEFEYDSAVRFRETLASLGPTFIKLGQALANRPDLVGKATATELTQLQDRLPPFPYEEVCRVMEQELGKPPHLLFDEFSPVPVAAGSLGQVHKARIGKEFFAVKVKRPGVLDAIGKDLYILRQAVGLLPFPVDLPNVVDDYGQALMEEIDYRREVENMIRFRKLYGGMPGILVPRIYSDYCSDSIITMEWVEGERIVQRSLSVSKEDLPLLERGIKCTLKQLLDDGFLHADPHGGNLLKTNENPSRLAYLDFGIVTEVPLVVRDSILRAVVFLVNGDFESLAGTFPGLLILKEEEVRDRLPQFASALRKLFGPLLDEAKSKGEMVPRLPFGALLEQMFDVAQSFRFSVPPYFISNVRALAELEGLALAADPNYNLLSSVYPFAIQRMLVDPDATLRTSLEQLIFDPEEGLRTEVLRSIFGLTMPMPCVPRKRSSSKNENGSSTVPEVLPSCDEFISVAPTREEYSFVQRVLVKLMVARFWAYLSMWLDDLQAKLPKLIREGLPERDIFYYKVTKTNQSSSSSRIDSFILAMCHAYKGILPCHWKIIIQILEKELESLLDPAFGSTLKAFGMFVVELIRHHPVSSHRTKRLVQLAPENNPNLPSNPNRLIRLPSVTLKSTTHNKRQHAPLR
eukprot:gene3791-7529_t